MIKMVLLDADTLGDVSLDGFTKLGHLTRYEHTKPEQRLERCQRMEVIITNKVLIDSDLIDQLPELKLICIAATGMNNVDLTHAQNKGIAVKNVAGYSTDSVAQHTLALALGLLNNIEYFDRYVKSGTYSNSGSFTYINRYMIELTGKKWGIVGMGTIGKRVAQLAEAFKCEILFYSTSGKNTTSNYQSVTLNELITQCNIISIHAPLNEYTANLIAARELKLMNAATIIINTGRGGIVNEHDVAEAIKHHRIGGYATDVFESEPLKSDNPLLSLADSNRILLSPHVAWASLEARQRLIEQVIQNITNFTTAY